MTTTTEEIPSKSGTWTKTKMVSTILVVLLAIVAIPAILVTKRGGSGTRAAGQEDPQGAKLTFDYADRDHVEQVIGKPLPCDDEPSSCSTDGVDAACTCADGVWLGYEDDGWHKFRGSRDEKDNDKNRKLVFDPRDDIRFAVDFEYKTDRVSIFEIRDWTIFAGDYLDDVSFWLKSQNSENGFRTSGSYTVNHNLYATYGSWYDGQMTVGGKDSPRIGNAHEYIGELFVGKRRSNPKWYINFDDNTEDTTAATIQLVGSKFECAAKIAGGVSVDATGVPGVSVGGECEAHSTQQCWNSLQGGVVMCKGTNPGKFELRFTVAWLNQA